MTDTTTTTTKPTADFWLDVRYIDNHILMTGNDVWTYLVLPGVATNLPTRDFTNSLVNSVETILGGLGREVELHYHLAYRDLDTKSWASELDASCTAATPAWGDYLRRMRMRLLQRGYQDRVLYLGVRLGSRRGLIKPQLRGAAPVEHAKAWFGALVGMAAGPDPQPNAEEVARWREVAIKTRTALRSSALDARGASASEVAWLIRHVQRLGMPEGARDQQGREWGAGNVHSLSEAVVDNDDHTQLTIGLTGRNTNIDLLRERHQGLLGSGAEPGFSPSSTYRTHVAILPVGTMPDAIASPWLYHASAANFPVEVSARIKVISPEQAEKDAAKAARLQRNTITDSVDAGVAVHGRDARRAGGAISLAEEQASGDGRRQIVATYRLIVAHEDREDLAAMAEEVIRHYREDNALGVTIEWPPGDQLALWEELIPGQSKRTKLYEQRQDLVTFAVGLPFSVSRSGDSVGPYLGSIQTGNPAPVFYDMATAAKRGMAPTLALTGTLGGGKTFALLTMMDHFRMRGFPMIALDPKGDIKAHLLLTGRGNARFFDLSTDGLPGSLDPFTLVSNEVDTNDPARNTPELADARWREETRTLVMDVLGQLLQEAMDSRMSTAVAMALNFEMSQPRPSMWNLLETLRMGGVAPTDGVEIAASTLSEFKMAAIGAHAQLKNVSETQLGRLMFAPRNATDGGMLFQGGVPTTIVSLSGLDLPKDGRAPSSPEQRFSVALFSLVAHQARAMLQDLDYIGPRALIIDEAHQITSLPSGRSLIVSNGRMGRSRDIAMLLATQSAADLNGPDLRNVISAVFAFRTNEKEEREDISQLLGRERDDEAVHAMLPKDTDPAGTCLFLDLDKNLSLIRIDRWANEYSVFETNPDRENVSAAGTRIVSDQFGVVHDPMGPSRPAAPAARHQVQPAPAAAALGSDVTYAPVAAAVLQKAPVQQFAPVPKLAPVAPVMPAVQQHAPRSRPVEAPRPVASPQVPVSVPEAGVDEGWWGN